MTDIAIEFEHVSKRFRRGQSFDSLRDFVPALFNSRFGLKTLDTRDFWALNDICLTVRKGETLGVIGHNGAGKSTMLKHLAGIMIPSKGRIVVDGRLSALIEVGAGFHQDLTGRENVFLNGVILGMTRAEVARKFDEMVEFAGMEAFIDTPVKRYSSGMYARLGFAVAAHLDPDILVIDEVLSVGDFVFQQKSMLKMRNIASGGATVLFVSHNLKAVSDLCARTILLDSGMIVADGPTASVLQKYLDRERAKLDVIRDGVVTVRSVILRGINGRTANFRPGDKAWIDVIFSANQSCDNIAVIVSVHDDGMGKVFSTATERLGTPPIQLTTGQSCSMTFEFNMHLAPGTFHIGIYLFNYSVQKEYDRVLPAATLFMESEVDMSGSVNLYPRVAKIELS